jgi:hypothetical protein
MKKISLVVMVLLVANNAFSQAKFGIKAGVNFSSLSDVEYTNADGTYRFIQFEKDGMATGYHAGIFTNVHLWNIISFQPELLFSMQGGKMLEYEGLNCGSGWVAGPNLNYQFGYIQIPILFEIKPFAGIGILAGVQYSFNVSQKCTSTYDGYKEIFTGSEFYNNIFGEGFKKRDTGLIFGLQYAFMEKITIGARYNLGLLNNWDFEQPYDKTQTSKGWKTGVIQVGLGFSF